MASDIGDGSLAVRASSSAMPAAISWAISWTRRSGTSAASAGASANSLSATACSDSMNPEVASAGSSRAMSRAAPVRGRSTWVGTVRCRPAASARRRRSLTAVAAWAAARRASNGSGWPVRVVLRGVPKSTSS